nr:phosphopantetheine-binding protein [Streptomyces thermoviolaceus]
MCEDPAVDQAVVFPDPRTGTALWAFTVPADPRHAPLPGEAVRLTGAERDTLVAPLEAHLPDWAVPRVLYRVSVLPKNPHGKIDKRSLSDWATATAAAGSGGAGQAPGTAEAPGTREAPGAPAAPAGSEAPGGSDMPGPRAEPESADASLSTVVDIFREVLGAPGIGPDDDFFEHGGQSLLAMRLLVRLRESFPSAAGLRASAVLRCPTPRLLAGALAADRAARL